LSEEVVYYAALPGQTALEGWQDAGARENQADGKLDKWIESVIIVGSSGLGESVPARTARKTSQQDA
jgi:hypothetical protein